MIHTTAASSSPSFEVLPLAAPTQSAPASAASSADGAAGIEQRVEQAAALALKRVAADPSEVKVEGAAAQALASSPAVIPAAVPARPLRLRALSVYTTPDTGPPAGVCVSSLMARRMERLQGLAKTAGVVTLAAPEGPAPETPKLHAQTVADLFLQALSDRETLPPILVEVCRGAGPVKTDSVLVPVRRELHALKTRNFLFDAMLIEEWTWRLADLGAVGAGLLHGLNRWMSMAGFLEGWLRPAPHRLLGQDESAVTRCYVAQLEAAKAPFHRIFARLRISPAAVQMASEQRLETLKKWEAVQSLLTLMPVSTPLSLERLLSADLDQIQRVVTIATGIACTEGRVDWAAAWEAESRPSAIRGLAERLHPVVAMGLEDLGLEPYDILIRLVQHPLVILLNYGVLPEHLERFVAFDQKIVLQYPWAFVAAYQTWNHLPQALKRGLLPDAVAVVEQIWICRRLMWEGRGPSLELFAANAWSGREIRFTGAIPEPSDLATPSSIDQSRRKAEAMRRKLRLLDGPS